MYWRRLLNAGVGVACVSASVLATSSVPLGAQLPDDPTPGAARLAFDLSKPFFEEDGFGAATSTLYVSGQVPVRRATVLLGLGLSHATAEGSSSTMLGNLRVGFLAEGSNGLQFELAGTLPTARKIAGDDDFAVATAWVADFERPERFLRDVASLSGQLARTWGGEGTAPSWRVRGGFMGLFSTEGSDDTEAFARYGVSTRIPFDRTTLRLEAGGIARLSGDGLSFTERTTHTIGAAVAFRRASGATPEVYLRFPLDSDLSDALDVVVGMRVVL